MSRRKQSNDDNQFFLKPIAKESRFMVCFIENARNLKLQPMVNVLKVYNQTKAASPKKSWFEETV
jgi:hypothetical protein